MLLCCEQAGLSFLSKTHQTPVAIAIGSPPQHGKSWAATDLIAWIAGKNPDLKAIYASYSDELGTRTNVDLQRMMQAPQYKLIFPNTRVNVNGWQCNTSLIEYANRFGSFRNTTTMVSGEDGHPLLAVLISWVVSRKVVGTAPVVLVASPGASLATGASGRFELDWRLGALAARSCCDVTVFNVEPGRTGTTGAGTHPPMGRSIPYTWLADISVIYHTPFDPLASLFPFLKGMFDIPTCLIHQVIFATLAGQNRHPDGSRERRWHRASCSARSFKDFAWKVASL
jgi:hypothetical protein